MDMNQIELRDDEHRDPHRLRRRSTVTVVSTPSKIAPRDHVVKVGLQCGFCVFQRRAQVFSFIGLNCCLNIKYIKTGKDQSICLRKVFIVALGMPPQRPPRCREIAYC